MSNPIIKLTHSRKARGFTLIELMITIVIVGILASAALPAFSQFVATQRIKTASFDLMSTLIFARSEGLKRNNLVNVSYVAASNEFVVTITLAGVVTTLRRQALPTNVQVTCGGVTCAGPGLNYNSSGRLAAAVDPVEISGTSSNDKRCISIDLSGRPKSKKGAC